MLLECISLSSQVCTICLVLLARDAETFHFTSDAEELVFLFFEAELGVSQLN